jgi:hypothetical protein
MVVPVTLTPVSASTITGEVLIVDAGMHLNAVPLRGR